MQYDLLRFSVTTGAIDDLNNQVNSRAAAGWRVHTMEAVPSSGSLNPQILLLLEHDD